MRIVMQNGCLLMSNPETFSEKVFMETCHGLVSQLSWKGNVNIEFQVASMAANGNVTHVSLTPIIPEGFEVDERGEVSRKICRCQHCGGPNH